MAAFFQSKMEATSRTSTMAVPMGKSKVAMATLIQVVYTVVGSFGTDRFTVVTNSSNKFHNRLEYVVLRIGYNKMGPSKGTEVFLTNTS